MHNIWIFPKWSTKLQNVQDENVFFTYRIRILEMWKSNFI